MHFIKPVSVGDLLQVIARPVYSNGDNVVINAEVPPTPPPTYPTVAQRLHEHIFPGR